MHAWPWYVHDSCMCYSHSTCMYYGQDGFGNIWVQLNKLAISRCDPGGTDCNTQTILVCPSISVGGPFQICMIRRLRIPRRSSVP